MQRRWRELGQLQHLTNDGLLKMLYLAMIDILKNGPDASGIGAGFMYNYLCFSPSLCPSNIAEPGDGV